ncbi:Protein sickie [Papilio machaon]|uniref:Protein sickie n=1 Tax=Papilio machaon TaxID=76193 RepID=A0A194RDK9_PAPMA|nr:Protein sickie [Papilio machaon]
MAVTTSPSYHGSPIHDGFATIRAPRSRIKIRNLVEPNNPANLPQRHSEYFTLQRNSTNNFLDSSVVVQYANNEPVNNSNDADKPLRLSFTEPIYAKVTPPHSKCTSPVKRNGKLDVHYDSIDTKPRRRLKSLEYSSGTDLKIDEKNGIAIISNGDRPPSEVYSANQDSSEQHSVRTDTTGSSVDYRKRHTDRDNCSESSSCFTDNDRPISSYSDNSTIPSTDTEDVLKELPNKSRFHKSPQKFATLNLRRPKFIDLKQPSSKENQFYGSLHRNKMGYHSEPNTPLTGDRVDLSDESSLLDQVQQIPRMPLQNNRNGFRRSVSETNGFSKRLSYRHSFSADYKSSVVKKPHKCCECVTGIPAEEEETQATRTLGTLYETQDPKVGCQTILRSKPPIPWWELAIKKSRYKSCPILEEAHVVSAFEQSLSNMTQRLQQLTATAERKDSELTELRQTIELLRKQSIQAGLTTAHMQSMGIRADGVNVTGQEPSSTQAPQSSPQRLQTGNGAITRHLSTDSVSSINSLSSGSSMPHDKKHKKKGWLRSSFTKAFSRNAKISKTAKHSSLGQLSSQDSSSGSHHYDDPHTIREGSNENSLEHSHEALDEAKDKPCPAKTDEQAKDKPDDAGLVDELKRQLREKDLVLTDIRLEALSSAHQLESLKDTVIKMRNEMLNLKQNNERLQRLVTSRSLAGSQSSLPAADDPRRFSLADQPHQTSMDMHSQPLDLDFTLTSTPTMDFSKKGSPKSGMVEPIYGNKAVCELNENSEAILGALNGSGDIFTNGLSAGDRLSGDYDINTVLPPPKTRELAIGESYSDIGVADSQGDTTDGKKIAIAVYLGQPETFQRYFEEVQDTLTESECRFYAKQSAAAFNHFEKQSSYDSPRMSQTHSPETETQDYPQSINKSNTNSLKSNKSTHSNSYKNLYNSDSTVNCNEFTIAYTYISGKTTWQNLDYIVRKTFKDYLSRIDPGTNLGLNTDSITSYHLGEATRGPEIGFPELLPCGYIVGTVNTLYICLQGVGSLAFDSLIPKNIVYRYVSLLSEHRRVILCGPSGTGKSYLATKLAEFYVQRTQRRGNPAEAVATFNVDRKSCNELRAYLANIAEQCSAAGAEEAALPSVVLLDNLQHASALGDAFAGLLPPDNRNMPVIIGTMSQATCNTTNLQLHHNFRWLLTANHMEPVKGFLARYLRRKLFSLELRLGRREPALAAVLEWLPGVWAALNAFLEAHSSSDVTVGPRLFLACPMDLEASQVSLTMSS